MCDNDENLIDLTVESEFLEMNKTGSTHPSNEVAARGTALLLTPANCSDEAREERRDSLDNNPFDTAQEMVKKLNDPFESVESEACFKAHCSTLRSVDVKEGILLSLSDDISSHSDWDTCERTIKAFDNTTTASSAFYSLENISPPVSFYKSTPETSENSAAESGGSSTDNSAKTKTAFELRKRLLKMSISNSSFNSPLSRHAAIPKGLKEMDERFSLLNNKFDKVTYDEDKLLSSESPLKFADDDVVFADEPPCFSVTQSDFEADLEMLRIPMLKRLQTPVLTEPATLKDLQPAGTLTSEFDDPTTSPLLNLEAIRAKLQAKRDASKHVPPDVSRIICDLKSLLSHMAVTDEDKKQEASALLETLSSALMERSDKQNDSSTAGAQVPGAIVRQGTFDVELQQNEKQGTSSESNASACEEPPEQFIQTIPTMQSGDIPDVMVKSSATYDGETADEKHDYVLPVIAPMTPPSAPNIIQQDWSEIIEQLTQIFEQQQQTNGNCGNNAALQKQTIIVVPMPIPSAASSQRPSPEATDSDDPFYQQASANYNGARRRSQSLSIHDKIRVLQFPPKKKNEEQKLEEIVLSPPRDVSMHVMRRRNSFSCGSPATPPACCTMTEMSATPRALDTHARASSLFPRRLTALSTHLEQQQSENAEIRHLPLPLDKLHKIKPGLKRRPHKSSENSVMKSSVPLKATIPVKKVAPMVKISPSKQDYNCNDKNNSFRRNYSTPIHPSIKPRSMYVTSTPVPAAIGNPKACSTPATSLIPPLQSGTARLTKPRYSVKQPSPSKNTSVLTKRRSFSEVRPKSPMRPRLSSYGARPTSVLAPKPLVKPPVVKSNLSKTPNKIGAPAVDKRAFTPKSAPRASFKGFSTGTRNKENWQP